MALAEEGVPFYLLYATIHSTEVGNTQALITLAHRMATEQSPEINEILDNRSITLTLRQKKVRNKLENWATHGSTR